MVRKSPLLLLLALVACEAAGDGQEPGSTGVIALGLSQAPAGVSGVLARITCGDVVVERYAPLESEGLPDHVDAQLAGHAFADAFAVVPAGTCKVDVWAMADEATLAPCGSASATVDVVAGKTSEVLLVLACDPGPTGGVDVAVVIDQPPVIEALVVAPGLEVPACTAAIVRVEASDPDGDALAVTFDVDGPADGGWDASQSGDDLVLVAQTEGSYVVTATVSDGLIDVSAKVKLNVVAGSCAP